MNYRLIAITPLGVFTSVLLSETEKDETVALIKKPLTFLSFLAIGGPVILQKGVIKRSVFRVEEVSA